MLETLQRYPSLVATRIYDMVVDRGYTGSLRTLRRFVLPHRPAVPREVYVRIETLAGEQSQIDWAHVGHIRVKGGVPAALLLRAPAPLLARDVGRARARADDREPGAILATKPGARDGNGRDRLRAEIPHADELMRRWLEDGRNVGSLVARTLKLLDLYGASIVASAVDDLLAKGGHDLGALAILCEQRCTRPRRVLPVEIGPHVVDRDVIPHDLGGYDDDAE